MDTFDKAPDRRQSWQRRLAGTVLACGAVTALGLGLATPANAATIGQITNFAPGWVFKSPSPSRQEVFNTVWSGAFRACRNDHPATKSIELVRYTQSGPRGQVTSWWNCRNTP